MFHNLDLEFTVCWRGTGLCLVRVRHRDSMSVGNQRHTMSAWQVQMARAEVKRVPWPKPDGRRMGDGWRMVNGVRLDVSPMAIHGPMFVSYAQQAHPRSKIIETVCFPKVDVKLAFGLPMVSRSDITVA